MRIKNCRIVGESYRRYDEDTFLASIELEEVEKSTRLFVSLVVIDDAVSWRVNDFDFCKTLLASWETSEGEDEVDWEHAIEDHSDFEDTEESPYRVFYCMLENLWNAAHTTYHILQ